MSDIKINRIDRIGIITFDNDKYRNSMSELMLNEIINAFDNLEKQKVRVIILRCNPDARVWSAGLDIKSLPKSGKDPLSFSHPLEALFRKIENIAAPVIAMITGSVWGGGVDLALSCDIIVGTPECSFAITPVKLGVPYNSKGLEHFLNILPVNIIKEMFFTAEPLSSDRAYNIGLLNHIISEDQIEPFVMDMAEKISSNSPLGIKVVKEQINLLTNARPLTPDIYERINELRMIAYTSDDYKEGLEAFFDKRKPKFFGE